MEFKQMTGVENYYVAKGYKDITYCIEHFPEFGVYCVDNGNGHEYEYTNLADAVSHYEQLDKAHIMADILANGCKVQVADCYGGQIDLWNDCDEIAFVYCASATIAKMFRDWLCDMVDCGMLNMDDALMEYDSGATAQIYYRENGGKLRIIPDGLYNFMQCVFVNN